MSRLLISAELLKQWTDKSDATFQAIDIIDEAISRLLYSPRDYVSWQALRTLHHARRLLMVTTSTLASYLNHESAYSIREADRERLVA